MSVNPIPKSSLYIKTFFTMPCRFEKDDSIIRSLTCYRQRWLNIEFYNSREQRAENKLCKLEMDLPLEKRDIEVKVSLGEKQHYKDVVLTSVSNQINLTKPNAF